MPASVLQTYKHTTYTHHTHITHPSHITHTSHTKQTLTPTTITRSPSISTYKLYATRSYYFPSQTPHLPTRVAETKMDGSERSLGAHLCFRPCPTRWLGRIHIYTHLYTRTRHHWREPFLACQIHLDLIAHRPRAPHTCCVTRHSFSSFVSAEIRSGCGVINFLPSEPSLL
jgi:hypothetical protein